jgi:DNA-binding beta-propeller fold protein YncE
MPRIRCGFDAALVLCCLIFAAACSSPNNGGSGLFVDSYGGSDISLTVDAVEPALDATASNTEDASAEDGLAGFDAIFDDGFFDDDTGPDPDATGSDVQSGQTAPPWLLSIDNKAHKLLKIDIVTGKTAAVCTLPTGSQYSYPSLTFRRDNVLVASRKGSSLDEIDPCTCAVKAVGSYGGATQVNGITSNHAQGLFGISAGLQTLISIDPTTGAAKSIGKLGVKFTANGATWSDAIKALYAINSADDTLYVVDPATGIASPQAVLSKPFGSVGVERHPGNGQIYACTDDGFLRKIDPVTGNVTEIGAMGALGACTNLAAPWGPVKCVDDVQLP